jgi:hypothetical protein
VEIESVMKKHASSSLSRLAPATFYRSRSVDGDEDEVEVEVEVKVGVEMGAGGRGLHWQHEREDGVGGVGGKEWVTGTRGRITGWLAGWLLAGTSGRRFGIWDSSTTCAMRTLV